MSMTDGVNNIPRTIYMETNAEGPICTYIDQRELPYKLVEVSTSDWLQVVDAVKTLAVRGAPAIGIAGATALTLWAFQHAQEDSTVTSEQELREAAEVIATARPTAVNLRWAVERALNAVHDHDAKKDALKMAQALYEFSVKLVEEDVATNRAIGENGASLVPNGARLLTHCNAGSLATAFYGTALGVVYAAHSQGKVKRVYADETRPVGQGARLTTWELARAGVPATLICDDMAASLMAQGNVDAVFVGADRIARNGDTANKIGTYGVAIMAKHHGIPFYVAAPTSTIDSSIADGSQIIIEQRLAEEVLPKPLKGVDVWNPAFDVTPAGLITKIITEKGVFAPEELVLQL